MRIRLVDLIICDDSLSVKVAFGNKISIHNNRFFLKNVKRKKRETKRPEEM